MEPQQLQSGDSSHLIIYIAIAVIFISVVYIFYSIFVSKSVKGDKGEKGDKGDIGEKGDKGDIGEKGDKGDIGPSGPANGAKGDIGPTGPKGDIGPTGPQGDIGPTGPTGPKGDTGPVNFDASLSTSNKVIINSNDPSISVNKFTFLATKSDESDAIRYLSNYSTPPGTIVMGGPDLNQSNSSINYYWKGLNNQIFFQSFKANSILINNYIRSSIDIDGKAQVIKTVTPGLNNIAGTYQESSQSTIQSIAGGLLGSSSTTISIINKTSELTLTNVSGDGSCNFYIDYTDFGPNGYTASNKYFIIKYFPRTINSSTTQLQYMLYGYGSDEVNINNSPVVFTPSMYNVNLIGNKIILWPLQQNTALPYNGIQYQQFYFDLDGRILPRLNNKLCISSTSDGKIVLNPISGDKNSIEYKRQRWILTNKNNTLETLPSNVLDIIKTSFKQPSNSIRTTYRAPIDI